MSEPIEELLQAYLDGELQPAARADLEKRISSEPELREELDRLSFARDAVTGLPQAEAPTDLADRVLQRTRGEATLASHTPVGQSAWPMAWRVAAVIAVLVLPGGGFAAGYRVGSSAGPDAPMSPEGVVPAATTVAAVDPGPIDFLVLLHGNAGSEELAQEQRSWRDLQYTNWADSLLGSGRLVRADDLSEDTGQGVWADGNVSAGEIWFANSGVVPTRSYVVKAWDYDQALDIARTSPHLAFGGSVTVRQITDGP